MKADLQKSQADMKADNQKSQADLKTNLQKSQADLKIDLQKSQTDLKTDLQKSQTDLKTDLHKLLDANNYKLVGLICGAIVASVAFFEGIGGQIVFPWKKVSFYMARRFIF